MVETREKTPIARVLDFGLAAEIRSSMSRVSTENGDTSGTRPYMAPEQWQGKKQGPATDQYALACMFYELVSGAVPFAGVFETGDFNLMVYSVENRSPDPLDELSEEQNAALQRALSKNPNDRFASCVEFLSVLQGFEVPQIKQNSIKHASTKTVICNKCGFENNKTALFCKGCGEKIERDDICLKCGAEIDPNQKHCDKCGAKTPKFIALEKAEAERKARETFEAERKDREEAERKAREKAEAEGKISVAGIEMVRIPDSYTHKGLYFGIYQVTQAQWQAIMGENPSRFKGDLSRPVEMVSWYDCQEFIEKLNARADVKQAGITFRLPTEKEWEYACRAGSTGKYGLLADGREGSLDEMGWYKDNSGGETHPVGQKKPNAWGLYDMHGNVWDWTASEGDYGRICRGGNWGDYAERCEAGYRANGYPDSRNIYVGFRLVASLVNKKFESVKKTDPDMNSGVKYHSNSKIRWLPTFLLCIFFSYFGGHLFYTKDTKLAVKRLLFVIFSIITGIVAGCSLDAASLFGPLCLISFITASIWNLVDFIRLACGSYKTSDGRLISYK